MDKNLAELLRTKVLEEYNGAKNLVFPMFPIKVNGKIIKSPNLMQRRVVYEVLQKRNFGNWSDMGTGKTLAAILSAYIVGAKVSLICCPNSVKEEWRVHILGVFPRANIIESIKKVNIQIRLNK